MVNRIRQYPQFKLQADRDILATPANNLLYILSTIRELYNTSGNGHSANNIKSLGYEQLENFLWNTLWLTEEEILQHQQLHSDPDHSSNRGRANDLIGLGDFVSWATILVLRWTHSNDERISKALQVFGPVGDRLYVHAQLWRKMSEADPSKGEREAKRFRVLYTLLSDSFKILVEQYEDAGHRRLGFPQIQLLVEETNLMLEPFHGFISEVKPNGLSMRMKRTLALLLAVLDGSGETASCFRVEYALLVVLPLMPAVVDAVYDLIPSQLWVETLQECGLGSFAAALGREFGLRNDKRLGVEVRGKLGRMLGSEKEVEKEERAVRDIGLQLGQLRIEDTTQ